MADDYGTKLVTAIVEHLTAGGVVIISTYTKAWQFDSRHVDFFKIGSDGHAYVRRGKNWDDFNYSSVKFYTYAKDTNNAKPS